MARIRSIHPEFCTDELLAELPARVERTFVRLWPHLDDDGRAVDNPRLLKASLYPLHDDMTAAEVDADLAVLAQAGLVLRYEVDGRRYLSAKPEAWKQYQNPRHPKESKFPPPPDDYVPPTADCRNGTASSPCNGDPVRLERRGVGEGVGVGEEKTVVEKPSTELVLVSADASPSATSNAVAVFDAWRESTGKSKAKLDPKRKRLIDRALKELGYPVEDLIDAVRGWRHFPHNRGENERATVYNDLELILRDSAHIERFRDAERGEHTQQGPVLSSNAQRLKAWAGGRR